MLPGWNESKEDFFDLWAHFWVFCSWMFLSMILGELISVLLKSAVSVRIWGSSSNSSTVLSTVQICWPRLSSGFLGLLSQRISLPITTNVPNKLSKVWTCSETSSHWQLRSCGGGLVLGQSTNPEAEIYEYYTAQKSSLSSCPTLSPLYDYWYWLLLFLNLNF